MLNLPHLTLKDIIQSITEFSTPLPYFTVLYMVFKWATKLTENGRTNRTCSDLPRIFRASKITAKRNEVARKQECCDI